MSFVSMQADLLKIKEDVAIKLIRAAVRQQMRVAARAFIRAAFPRVPVDTGMSRGAFLGVAKALRVKVPIAPRRFRTVTIDGKNYKLDNTKQRYKNGQIKSPDLGTRLTDVNSVPSKGISQGGVILTRGSKFTFRLNVNILQYDIHDAGTWRALEAGRAAFTQHMLTVASTRLPTIDKYLVKSTLKVNGQTITKSKEQFLRRRIPNLRDRERSAFELGLTSGEGLGDLPVDQI